MKMQTGVRVEAEVWPENRCCPCMPFGPSQQQRAVGSEDLILKEKKPTHLPTSTHNIGTRQRDRRTVIYNSFFGFIIIIKRVFYNSQGQPLH